MKQTARESEAFRLASNWLRDQKGIKITDQRDKYEMYKGGTKDRFYQIRTKGSVPYERDLEAMNKVHPEFIDKYNYYLDTGVNPVDLERAGGELNSIIAELKRMASEKQESRESEIQALKDLIVHLKETDALNKRLLNELLDNLKPK